jgi:hypothetical protein
MPYEFGTGNIQRFSGLNLEVFSYPIEKKGWN